MSQQAPMAGGSIRSLDVPAPRVLRLPAAYVLGVSAIYAKLFMQQTTLFELDALADNTLLLLGVLFLLFHVYTTVHVYGRSLVWVALALALTAVVYVKSRETSPFVATLIVIASATSDEPSYHMHLWMRLTLLLLTVLASFYLLVLVMDFDGLSFTYRVTDGFVSRVRYAIFLLHPNMTAAVVMMLLCTYLYTRMGRITFVTVMGSVAFAFLVMYVTGSRTSFYLMLAAPFMFYIQQRWSFMDTKFVRVLMALLLPMLLLMVWLVSGPLYTDRFGALLTGRPWLWHVGMESMGITLFGQRFVPTIAMTLNGWYGTASTLDSFYANGLMVYGLAFTLSVCLTIMRLCFSNSSASHAAMPLLLITLLLGITEGHIINLFICPCLFLLGPCVLPNKGGTQLVIKSK